MASSRILWEGDGPAVVAQWFFDTDDTVAAGDVLGELMQEKAVIEVQAPAAGRLTLFATPEQEIAPGTVLAVVMS